MLSEKYLLELLKDESGGVCGAKVLDIRSGNMESYEAKSVVLATGGYSRIYGKHSTNSKASTGDGIAVAKRAGVKLIDMEFVQFHPTGLKNSSILISESARGEGGYIVNSQGLRFTDELAPRDVLSRAINEELGKGESVYLDIRHLGEEKINEGLPQERKLAILYENVDPVESLIPIKPVAHYTMGGIAVDRNSQTNITGLFACGECANHRVHGANRLGGNSLLEILVFGREAGRAAAQSLQTYSESSQSREQRAEPFAFKSSQKHKYDFYALQEELATLFYENVGIVRTTQELLEAKQKLEDVQQKLEDIGVSDSAQSYNTNLVEFLEFKNMLEMYGAVVESALQREVSIGAHYRVG
jgi:succinate dehydrogenase / fumarate reductase flavoprotein subunit